MISKHFIFLFAASLLLSSLQCQTQSLPSLKGRIVVDAGWKPMVYLIQPRNFKEIASNYSGMVIDSAIIGPDGSFVFSRLPQLEEAMLFQICVQKAGSRFANQLLDDEPTMANYMPLIWNKSESIEIEADAANFQASFSVKKPSAENQAMLRLRDLRHAAFSKQSKPGIEGSAENDEAHLLEAADALLRFQAPLMAFADSSAYLFPALVAARWVSPSSDYERVPEFLVGLCSKWSVKSKENPWTKQLCEMGDRKRLPVLLGDVIPNEALPMSSGDTVLLHKLLGSRLTILDIWASWCMPCRRENRDVLAPLWTEYQNKGIQIIGYSIDSSPAPWKAAIGKDGAVWPHASHLTGDATPFLEVLRITTIPANFVLDGEGKVIGKNLHGEALRAFVGEYLK